MTDIAMKGSLIARLGALFVLTGAGGLLAEQVFEKLLTTLVGASTPAGAVVLAVYFAGLTLGAWVFSRRAVRRPLRLYALLELGVALWALGLRFGNTTLEHALVPVLELGRDRFWLLQGLRGLIACVWILPPTLLMGASFPSVVAALERWGAEAPRRLMTGFYALNLLGALLGALLGPLVLFPSLGLDGTLFLIAGVDGSAGLLALWLARKEPAAVGAVEPATVVAPRHRGLTALAFGSGFLFFALEVLWTHLMSVALGNSVYAFAATLAMVLVGLLLGSAIASRRWPEAARATPATLGGILVMAAFALAMQFTFWPLVPNFFIGAGGWAEARGTPIDSFARAETLRWLAAGVMLVPSSTLLGLVYPLLFRLEQFPDAGRATLAARMGAWNSVGCVLGALGCGFGLIPALGSETTLRVIIAALGVTSVTLSARWVVARERRALVVVSLGVVGLALGMPAWDRLQLTNGGHVYFARAFVWPQSTLEYFHEDTLGGVTTVVKNRFPDGTSSLTLLTNGKFQANDARETEAQIGFAAVPLLHTAHLDDALVIGLGSGQSAGVIESAGFAHVDIAEISPGIVGAAREKFGGINQRVLDNPRVSLRLEDGRNHLLLTRSTYDLIVMEVTSVWFAGSSMLYSREFYDLARTHLRPGGVLQQWIQLHHITARELASVMRAMRDTFAEVSLWVVGGQGILLGTEGPQRPVPATLQTLLTWPQWKGGVDPEAALTTLLASRLLAPRDLEAWLASNDVPSNTDANRYLEYASPRYNLDPRDLREQNLAAMATFATWPAWNTDGWPPGLGARVQAITVSERRAAIGLPPK
jgi:spermidine synthase